MGGGHHTIGAMDVQGFHHLAIQVRDLEKVTAFYRDVLGFSELKRHHRSDGSLRSVWVEVPGGGFLALEEVSGEPEPGPFRHERPTYADPRQSSYHYLGEAGASEREDPYYFAPSMVRRIAD